MKQQIQQDMKQAMRERAQQRLGVIRMLMAAIKQQEIDSQKTLDDVAVLAIIRKMIKQRRDAAQQYSDAGRDELATTELQEVAILEPYLPAQISADQISQAVSAAIDEQNASSMRDMGKVMAALQQQLAGKADMSAVSAELKRQLQAKS